MSNWKKGTTLNSNQYIIESILLRSGYGLFYRAKDINTERLVTIIACKIFWQKQANAEQLQQKFISQAKKIAKKCQSPYIVRLYPEVFLEGNQAYMVMDYIEGVDLAHYINSYGKLSSDEALDIVSRIASALNVIHQRKTVHQDIKPYNIVIDSQTQNPILINYGMAIKLFTLGLRKSPHQINDCFIPPEILHTEQKLGIASDIYSLASILYVLVTGQLPVSANLRSNQNLPLPSPKELNPTLSDRFNNAILKGMELNLKQRPQYIKDWLNLFKEKKAPAGTFSLDELPTNLSELPKHKLAILDAIVTNDDTVVQKSRKNLTPSATSKRNQTTYPNIEKFTFKTVKIEEEKELFGLISQEKTNLITKKGEFFVEYLGEEINLEMVFIPAGTFMMGGNRNEAGKEKDENPQHRVNLKSFYISKYPITQQQWRIVSRFPKVSRNLNQKPSFFKGDNLPVERVSWFDSQEFCQRLSKYTGRTYRLPTESQWEYACRGNTQTAFFFGDTINPELANYDQGSHKRTTPVDNYYPNPFGLYDCHGNVWEWCEDHYSSNYTLQPKDGSAYYSTKDNSERVVRGGSWSLPDTYSRSAKRNAYTAESAYNFIGFRVVCVLD